MSYIFSFGSIAVSILMVTYFTASLTLDLINHSQPGVVKPFGWAIFIAVAAYFGYLYLGLPFLSFLVIYISLEFFAVVFFQIFNGRFLPEKKKKRGEKRKREEMY